MPDIVTKEDVYFIERNKAQERWDRIDERIKHTYKDSKAKFIYSVEEAIENCDPEDNFYVLFEIIKYTIQKKSIRHEEKWSSKRLSRHDFESVFWEEAYWIVKNYWDNYGGDFLYYETLVKALDLRAIDVIRKATKTGSGIVNNCAASLSEEFEQSIADKIDIEKDVTDRMFVEAMINDKALTTEEKELLEIFLKVLHLDGNASLRSIAKVAGYKHPEQVSRALKRIRKKLAKYEESYNSDIKCGHPYGQPKKRE